VKRFISTAVLIVVALGILTLIIVGANLGRIIKKGIEVYGPPLTQTSVSVDAVNLSVLTGSARVKGLVVGNPKGYNSLHAIAVGTAAAGVDPFSLFSQKIVIRSIKLESPDVTFEGGLGGNNLSQVLDNINSTEKSSGPLSTNAAAQPASEKKFEVDDLMISDAKVHVILTGASGGQPMTLSLPEIHLTDLGKDGDGITAADLSQRIMAAITVATIEAVTKAATNLDLNAASLKKAGQKVGNELNNLLQK
jgi:uncharacterized protein involved in outer membrane biogenesis